FHPETYMSHFRNRVDATMARRFSPELVLLCNHEELDYVEASPATSSDRTCPTEVHPILWALQKRTIEHVHRNAKDVVRTCLTGFAAYHLYWICTQGIGREAGCGTSCPYFCGAQSLGHGGYHF
ncbi:MAG: hypothetical protein KDE31_02550, partial [Caldilineaceae bacterium]|nr:hypothetical protein [Caldilineaceae bacterium]